MNRGFFMPKKLLIRPTLHNDKKLAGWTIDKDGSTRESTVWI